MRVLQTLAAATVALFCLSGCIDQPYNQTTAYNNGGYNNGYNDGSGQIIGKPHQLRNTAVGAGLGGVVGQILGRDSESTAAGAVVGGIIGSQLNTPN